MINYFISGITVDLMLHNMAGKPFSSLQPKLLLLVAPFVVPQAFAHLVPTALVIISFLIFLTKMTIVSTQWCQY